jgi:hypothetical protein
MAISVVPQPHEETNEETQAVSALGAKQDDEDCDPYLQISIPALRQSRKTRYIEHDRNPDWNETLTFTGVTGRMEMMDIRCMVSTRCARQPLVFHIRCGTENIAPARVRVAA